MREIAVEYSVNQGCFHKETLEEYIAGNIESMKLGKSTDYQLIGCFRSDAEAESFISTLKAVREAVGNFDGITAPKRQSRDIPNYDVTELKENRINIYQAETILKGAEILDFEYCTDGREPAKTGEDRSLCDLFLTVRTAAGEIRVIGLWGCPAKYGAEREPDCDNAPVLNISEYV